MISPSTTACTAAIAASSGSFSPIRRATIAVVDSDSPSPIANASASIASVSPTVATASAPSRPTQNVSTTANSDSRHISSTIGIASSRIDRFRSPLVKSWCDPRSASRTEAQNPGWRLGLSRHIHRSNECIGYPPDPNTRSFGALLRYPSAMRKFCAPTLLALCLCSVSLAHAADDHFPSNEDLRHVRSLSQPRLSPDGHSVLVQITDSTADGAKTHIWLVDVQQNTARQLTFTPASEKRGESSAEWMPDGSAILFVAHRGEHTQLYRTAHERRRSASLRIKLAPARRRIHPRPAPSRPHPARRPHPPNPSPSSVTSSATSSRPTAAPSPSSSTILKRPARKKSRTPKPTPSGSITIPTPRASTSSIPPPAKSPPPPFRRTSSTLPGPRKAIASSPSPKA